MAGKYTDVEEFINSAFKDAYKATLNYCKTDASNREYYSFAIRKDDQLPRGNENSFRFIIDHQASEVSIRVAVYPHHTRCLVKVDGDLSGFVSLKMRFREDGGGMNFRDAGTIYLQGAEDEDGKIVIEVTTENIRQLSSKIHLKSLIDDIDEQGKAGFVEVESAYTVLPLRDRNDHPKNDGNERNIFFHRGFDSLTAVQKMRVVFCAFYNSYIPQSQQPVFQYRSGVNNRLHMSDDVPAIGHLLKQFSTHDVILRPIQDTSFKRTLDSIIYKVYEMSLKGTIIGYINCEEKCNDETYMQVLDNQKNYLFHITSMGNFRSTEIKCLGTSLGSKHVDKHPPTFYDTKGQMLVSRTVTITEKPFVSFYQLLAHERTATVRPNPDFPHIFKINMTYRPELEINEFAMVLTGLMEVICMGELQKTTKLMANAQ